MMDQPQGQPQYPIKVPLVEEMHRLEGQAKTLNEYVPVPARIIGITKAQVLDFACGTGVWALKYARQKKRRWNITGIDLAPKMIAFGQRRAELDHLTNVSFQEMDGTKWPLSFPDATFDYIHSRAIQGFMAISAWPGLINEFMRILKPGGYIQLVEGERPIVNTPGFDELWSLMTLAGTRAGTNMSPMGHQFGVAQLLPSHLKEAGCELKEHTGHPIDFSAGMDPHTPWCANMSEVFGLISPYLLKYEVASAEKIQELRQKAEVEMYSEGFRGLMLAISIVGQKPKRAGQGK